MVILAELHIFAGIDMEDRATLTDELWVLQTGRIAALVEGDGLRGGVSSQGPCRAVDKLWGVLHLSVVGL